MTGNDELEENEAEIFRQSLEDHFGEVNDYRREGSINHRLIDILFITICAVISGANNLKAVSAYATRKQNWLIKTLELTMNAKYGWIFIEGQLG